MKTAPLAGVCALAVIAAMSGCSVSTPRSVAQVTPSAPATAAPSNFLPRWLPVNVPSVYADPRTIVYDRARDCIWVLDRVPDESQNEYAQLFRINVADRSVIAQPFRLDGTGFDVGLMALDSNDRLWTAWGRFLTRFDPDTGAIKQWILPPYSGLARLYSMDGRMAAMTIGSDGEIWLAAGMESAIFGFNPARETWDLPLSLPFVTPGWGTTIAEPVHGVITVNGAALGGSSADPSLQARFAIITTATRSVRVLSLPMSTYIPIGGDQILYVKWPAPPFTTGGGLVRYDVAYGTSTVIAATLPAPRTGANLALDAHGDVWLPFTTQGAQGIARLDPSTGAIIQFPFPTEIVYSVPPPTPPSGHCFAHECLPMPCDPQLMSACVPSVVSLDPRVQGMAADPSGNLWLVTEASSQTAEDLGARPTIAPVVELRPSV